MKSSSTKVKPSGSSVILISSLAYRAIPFSLIIVGYILSSSAVFVEVFGKPPRGFTNWFWTYVLSQKADTIALVRSIVFYVGAAQLAVGSFLILEKIATAVMTNLRGKQT